MGRSLVEFPGYFARGFAARENSLTGLAREGISGCAAKSFAHAPTPASYAGYVAMVLYCVSEVFLK